MSEFEDLVNERKQEILQLKEELDIEDIDEIIKVVEKHYISLPTSRIFTPDKKFTRALSFASADLAPTGGREKIEIAILGYSKPKDWNQIEREKILEAWEKGAVAQAKLIEEHKIMRIKTREGYKAVSVIDELVKDDSGVPQVIQGKILDGDEQPIPRDYFQTQGKEETAWENKHFGYPLGERWTMNIKGLTHNGEKDIYIQGGISSNYDGDWATPGADAFLLKIAPAFEFYDATVIIDEDKSTDNILIVKSLSAITPKTIMITEEVKDVMDDGTIEIQQVERPLEFIEYIYGVMEGVELLDENDEPYIYTPIVDFKAYLNAESKEEQDELKDKLFLVESRDYPEWHNLHRNLNKDGTVKKSANGSNYSTWDSIGLSVLVCKQVKQTKNGNDQLVLSGSGGKQLNAFMAPEHPKLIMEKKSECLLSFSTVRKGTRYDKKAMKSITDPINGDVQISNVMGIKFTLEVMD